MLKSHRNRSDVGTIRNAIAVGTLSAGLVLVACGGQPTASHTTTTKPTATTKHKVMAWLDNERESAAGQALVNDLLNAGNDLGSTNFPALHSDCLALATQDLQLQGMPPVPDPKIENYWSAGLSDALTAAEDCLKGTSTTGAVNMTLLGVAGTAFKKAGADWDEAGNLKDKLVSGTPASHPSSVSTSSAAPATTIVPGYINVSVTSSTGCVSEISLDITDDQDDFTNSDIGDLTGCSVTTPWTRKVPASDIEVDVTVTGSDSGGSIGCEVQAPGQAPDREFASGADATAECSYSAGN